MADKMTEAQCIAALRLLDQHGTYTAAAKAAGVSRTTFRDRVFEAKRRELSVGSVAIDKTTRLEMELSALKAENATLRHEQISAEQIRAEIWRIKGSPVTDVPWLAEPKSADNNRGMPCAMWSDWHYGEVVEPEEVDGYNQFNLAVANDRIQRLVDKTVDLCLNHMGRADIAYPGFVLMLGGDMISGDIHEELAETNELPPLACVHLLKDRLASAITHLADVFGRVFVPCVPGNHGRTGKKPRYKNRLYHSYEWNLYVMLEAHFRDKGDTRVSFLIPGPDAFFTIYGHRYLLTHGDTLGVKGGDGIIGAIGPIMRGTMKVGRAAATVGKDIDTMVIGHWHQTIWGPGDGVFVNNCLKGFDEYAKLNRFPASPPSQLLWFTHPVWGITAKWEVKLDKPLTARPVDKRLLTWEE